MPRTLLPPVVLVLVSVAVAIPTWAAPPNRGPDAEFGSDGFCDAQTQFEINQCAGKRRAVQDTRLNRVYRALKAKVDTDEWGQLRDAQRKWLKFRDAHCEWETATFEGASIYPTMVARCLEDLTQARADVLELRLDYLSRPLAYGLDPRLMSPERLAEIRGR